MPPSATRALSVGGDYLPRNLEALAMEGRLVQISTLGGPKADINLWTVMQKRLTILGSTLRARTVAEKSALAQAVRAHVWPIFESGGLRVVVYRTFPLRDAAAAHRLLESSEHIGKILLTT